jgi:hypothetical protein
LSSKASTITIARAGEQHAPRLALSYPHRRRHHAAQGIRPKQDEETGQGFEEDGEAPRREIEAQGEGYVAGDEGAGEEISGLSTNFASGA